MLLALYIVYQIAAVESLEFLNCFPSLSCESIYGKVTYGVVLWNVGHAGTKSLNNFTT